MSTGLPPFIEIIEQLIKSKALGNYLNCSRITQVIRIEKKDGTSEEVVRNGLEIVDTQKGEMYINAFMVLDSLVDIELTLLLARDILVNKNNSRVHRAFAEFLESLIARANIGGLQISQSMVQIEVGKYCYTYGGSRILTYSHSDENLRSYKAHIDHHLSILRAFYTSHYPEIAKYRIDLKLR